MASPISRRSSSELNSSKSADVVKLPILKPRQVIAALEKLGFGEIRQRGSHKQFRHADGRVTTVPDHRGRDVSPNLLRKILDDIGVKAEDFLRVI